MANYAGSAIIGLQVQDQTKSGMSRLKPAFSRAGRESGRAFGTSLSSEAMAGLKAFNTSASNTLSDLSRVVSGRSGMFTGFIRSAENAGSLAARAFADAFSNSTSRTMGRNTLLKAMGTTGIAGSISSVAGNLNAYPLLNTRTANNEINNSINRLLKQVRGGKVDLSDAYVFGSLLRKGTQIGGVPFTSAGKTALKTLPFEGAGMGLFRSLQSFSDFASRNGTITSSRVLSGYGSVVRNFLTDKKAGSIFGSNPEGILKAYKSFPGGANAIRAAVASAIAPLRELSKMSTFGVSGQSWGDILNARRRAGALNEYYGTKNRMTRDISSVLGEKTYANLWDRSPFARKNQSYGELARDYIGSQFGKQPIGFLNSKPSLRYYNDYVSRPGGINGRVADRRTWYGSSGLFGKLFAERPEEPYIKPIDSISRLKGIGAMAIKGAEQALPVGVIGGAVAALASLTPVVIGTVSAFKLLNGSLATFAKVEQKLNEAFAIIGPNKLGKNGAKEIKDEVYNVAKSSVLKAEDVAGIAYQFAKSGRSSSQIKSAIKGATDFTVSSGLSSQDATSLLADIQMAYDFKSNELSYVADKLTAAYTGSNMDANDLTTAMKASLAIAKSSGVSFDNLLKSFMQLADVNIKGGSANTVLRNLYMREGARPETVKALEDLGFKFEDVQGLDAGTYIQKLFDKMDELGFTTSQQMAYMRDILGMYGAAAMSLKGWEARSINPETGRNKYDDALINSNGNTSRVAQAKMEGWSGSIEKFNAQLDILRATVGDLFGSKLATFTQNIVQTDLPRYFKSIQVASEKLAGKLNGVRLDDYIRGAEAYTEVVMKSFFDTVKGVGNTAIGAGSLVKNVPWWAVPATIPLKAPSWVGEKLNNMGEYGKAQGQKWIMEDTTRRLNGFTDEYGNKTEGLKELKQDVYNGLVDLKSMKIETMDDFEAFRNKVADVRESISLLGQTVYDIKTPLEAYKASGHGFEGLDNLLNGLKNTEKWSNEAAYQLDNMASQASESAKAIEDETRARNRLGQAIDKEANERVQTEAEREAMDKGWEELGRYADSYYANGGAYEFNGSPSQGYRGFSPEDWQNGVAESYFARPDVKAEEVASEAGERFFESLGNSLINMMTPEEWQNGGAEKYYAEKKSDKAKSDELDYKRKLNRLEKRSAREMKEMAKQYQKEADEKDLQHQEELAQIQADQAENISGSLGGIGDLIGSNFGYISNKELNKAQVRYEPGTSVSTADIRGMLRDYGTADPRKVARMQTMENIQDMVMAKQQQEQMWYEYLDAITQAGVTNKMTIDSIIAREMTLDASNATFTIDKFSVGESLRMSVGKIEGGVNIPEVDTVNFGEGDADSLDTLNNIVEVITEFKDNSQKYFDEQSKPVQV